MAQRLLLQNNLQERLLSMALQLAEADRRSIQVQADLATSALLRQRLDPPEILHVTQQSS